MTFKTPVCSETPGLLSSYGGHLGTLQEAWQESRDASGGEAGDHVSLSSCHIHTGTPVNYKE